MPLSENDDLAPLQKRAYVAPELIELGPLEELTQGEGWAGDDDQFAWRGHGGSGSSRVRRTDPSGRNPCNLR